MGLLVRTLVLAFLTFLLAGCGGGEGGGVAAAAGGPGGNPTPPPTTGAVELALDFQAAGRVSGRIPSDATEVVVHLLDPATGAEVIPPVTVPHTPGQTGPESLTLQDVPPGQWQVFLEIRPGLGYRRETVTVQAGATATVDVGVPQDAVTLTLTPAAVQVPAGSTVDLAATLQLADGTLVPVGHLATWTTLDASTATVAAPGAVTGVASGLTTIEAAFGGLKSGVRVLVAPQGTTLTSVEVTPTGVSLRPGQTQQYTATGRFSNGAGLDLSAVATWSSTNTNFATVSGTGLATAVAAGDTQIRAACEGVTGGTTLTVLAPAQPTTWTLRGRDTKRNLLGVAYGADTYVAVDSLGQARRSTNGLDWSDPVAVSAQPLSDIAFGGGVFMAAGVDGKVYVSADGTSWTARDLNGFALAACNAVAYGNGAFVVTKNNGARSGIVLRSTDTDDWTVVSRHDVGTGDEGNLNVLPAVRFLNGVFVAGGGENNLYRSGDGLAWSRGTVAGTWVNVAWHTLAGGNGRFVAGAGSGEVVTSTDGLTWTEPVRQTGATLMALGFGANQFLMFNRPNTFNGLEDQATLKASPDGATWTVRSESQSLGVARCEFLNGGLVAVGQHAAGYGDARLSRPLVLLSQDGLTWTTGQGQDLREVGGRPDGFMAVGDAGTVRMTPNGADWEWGTTGTLLDLVGLAEGAGRIVAVGSTYLPRLTNGVDAGKNDRFVTAIHSSLNGTDWTASTLDLTPRQTLTSVAFGNGLFVAAGGDRRSTGATDAPVLLTSTNGVDWTAAPLPTGIAAAGAFANVEFVDGRFFLSGPGPSGSQKVWLTSTDGSTWTALNVNTTYHFVSVGFLGGRYLITVDTVGGAWTSTNGTTWTVASYTGFQPDWLARAGGGVWAGVGRVNLGSDFNEVFATALGSGLNGLAWTERFRDDQESAVREMTFANGTWVAVGDRGLILTSTP